MASGAMIMVCFFNDIAIKFFMINSKPIKKKAHGDAMVVSPNSIISFILCGPIGIIRAKRWFIVPIGSRLREIINGGRKHIHNKN